MGWMRGGTDEEDHVLHGREGTLWSGEEGLMGLLCKETDGLGEYISGFFTFWGFSRNDL